MAKHASTKTQNRSARWMGIAYGLTYQYPPDSAGTGSSLPPSEHVCNRCNHDRTCPCWKHPLTDLAPRDSCRYALACGLRAAASFGVEKGGSCLFANVSSPCIPPCEPLPCCALKLGRKIPNVSDGRCCTRWRLYSWWPCRLLLLIASRKKGCPAGGGCFCR
jgi:hypothetical protein